LDKNSPKSKTDPCNRKFTSFLVSEKLKPSLLKTVQPPAHVAQGFSAWTARQSRLEADCFSIFEAPLLSNWKVDF
jgi:hypothetical protein